MTGWNENTGRTDHTELMEYVDGLDVAALHYVAQDCREAIEANPEGRKAGHYMDTIHYIGMRLHKMRQAA